ncbi:TPA: hypothetical protein ACSP0J_002869 [Aeromonas veronii]|uniref:Uncharacterized protein n=1 Tax=Aeromonas veronii AMC34 TaxID=1073383 RepID=K1JEN7_AERVE|nr:hypothetical protein [Aeromonas veronii]EKB25068.1 hypothetical protein HMPREF1168_00109 [Aeromonas veronii AMC34]MCF5765025.1 hypothetical protein [Aeromonas veronii]
MSIELVLLRSVESLVQRRIARVERRLVQVNLSPAMLRDIGLEGYQGQISLVREREYQTGFRLGNRIT